MKKRGFIIAPSVLSADFTRLKEQIRQCEAAGADWLHLDIMDGHFVPNLTFGPFIVSAIRSVTSLPLDTHLMIRNPDAFAPAFAEAGANRLTVHVETCDHLHRTVQRIKELGLSAGVTLNPATPASTLQEIVPYVDLVLVMTVNPGFGGQKFIKSMPAKVREVSDMLRRHNPEAYLEVDGGVDTTTIVSLVKSGANAFVAGNAVFSGRSIGASIRALRRSAESASRP